MCEYVNQNNSGRVLFKVFVVDDTFGLGLSNELLKVLKSLDHNVLDVRGQSYDNSSNMKGKHKGL